MPPAAGVEAGGEAARARQQRAVAEGVRSRTVEVAASRLPEHPDAGQSGQCLASMYGDPQPTASGEIFDPTQLTAAHPTLPFHTMVEVTNTGYRAERDRADQRPGPLCGGAVSGFEHCSVFRDRFPRPGGGPRVVAGRGLNSCTAITTKITVKAGMWGV